MQRGEPLGLCVKASSPAAKPYLDAFDVGGVQRLPAQPHRDQEDNGLPPRTGPRRALGQRQVTQLHNVLFVHCRDTQTISHRTGTEKAREHTRGPGEEAHTQENKPTDKLQTTRNKEIILH